MDSPEWTKDAAFTVSRLGGESIRTRRWRYTQWYYGDKGFELYDHDNDPGEFVNLADNHEYIETMKNLREILKSKKEESRFEMFKKNNNAFNKVMKSKYKQ